MENINKNFQRFAAIFLFLIRAAFSVNRSCEYTITNTNHTLKLHYACNIRYPTSENEFVRKITQYNKPLNKDIEMVEYSNEGFLDDSC